MNPRFINPFLRRRGLVRPIGGTSLRGNEVEELKGTKAGLQRTKMFGETHADSECFSDSSMFKNFLAKDIWNLRIRKIIVWSGEYVNGIQIAYENINSNEKTLIWTDKHLGNHHTFSEHILELKPNEVVTGIEGRIQVWMQHLEIHTNESSYNFGESLEGSHFKVQLPFNYMMTGFCGATGGHVHNLGLEFFAITSWTTETHHFFPMRFQKFVKTVLMLSLIHPSTGQPRYLEPLLWKLPKDILLYIIYMISLDQFNSKDLHVEYSHLLKKAAEVPLL